MAALSLALAAALPAAGQNWQVTPRVALSGSWTDNLRLEPDAFARSGWVATVIPSLRIAHAGPRLRLDLDYRHHRDFFLGESDLDNSRNFLGAAATYEMVEQRLWLEGRAGITQENRSAFDPAVVAGAPDANANRAETRSFGISPVLRGRLGEVAEYNARFNESGLRAQGAGAADVDTSELQASVRSAAPSARIGWSVDMSALRTRSDAFGTLDDRRLRAALIYAPLPQVHLSLIHGLERTDFARDGNDTETTPGAGLEWSPGPRTQFAAIAQRRFFGTGHLVTLRHRTPHTVWRLASTRESTVLSSILGSNAVTLGTLMSDLLTSAIPDPVARAAAVRRRLAELGSAPTTIGTGFLTERPFLNKGIDGSVAIVGTRNTLTVTYYRHLQTALGAPLFAGDSFALSENIRQAGYTATLTHRLTPLTSLSLASSRLRSRGLDGGGPASDQSLDTLFLSTRLGPRSTASLGLRRVHFESNTANSYRENAVFGSVSFGL